MEIMETKEIKIEVPEGYEIDKENSSFEKIVFKKKVIDTKPKSWKEYCEQQTANCKRGYQINDAVCSISEVRRCTCSTPQNWRNVLPTKELNEAFLAMMQLVSLRQAWIGDWQPNWLDSSDKWCIVTFDGKLDTVNYGRVSRSLNFPTKKMSEEFLDCFEDLIEIAKPLI